MRKFELYLPGKKTIPELIVERRTHNRNALRAADEAWAKGELDVGEMEKFLDSVLAEQLVSIHHQATGKNPETALSCIHTAKYRPPENRMPSFRQIRIQSIATQLALIAMASIWSLGFRSGSIQREISRSCTWS
ncbi:MAG: hypothetical protein JNL62_19320 [Bryobacterales bacterium]|nr:hypothetical protein [Bryobacterales bacterium]